MSGAKVGGGALVDVTVGGSGVFAARTGEFVGNSVFVADGVGSLDG